MSEVEAEIPETGPIGVDDVLAAIQQKNIGQAKAHFQDVMGQKVNDALEAEKVAIASQVFNPHIDVNEPAPNAAELVADDEEADDEEVAEEEELDFEDEVSDAFEEEEEEEEEDAEVS
jgi:hypothetical protein